MIDYVGKSGALLKEGKAMPALIMCEQGRGEGCPDEAALMVNEGIAYLYMKDFEKSLECFDKACELDPNDGDAQYNRSMAIRSMERHEEALANYETTYAKFPTHFFNLMNCGNVRRRLGKLDEAVEVYQKALEQRPDSWEIMYNIACVYVLQKKYNEAMELIEEALKLNDDFGELYYIKAICLKNLGDEAGKEAAYNIAIKYKPEDDRPPHGWGPHPELLEEPHGPCMRSEVIKGIEM